MTGAESDELSRFLRQHKQSSGKSFREIAKLAIDPDSGDAVGFQWLDRLANNQIAKCPDPWQLRALAAGLDVALDVVKDLAARQWVQYESRQLSLGTPWDWVLYPQVRGMSEEDQETLRQVVVAFIASRRQAEVRAAGGREGDHGTAHG